MRHSWTTSAELVLRAALFTLITGCGIATTNGPQPVSTGPSSGSPSVAPTGLQLGILWQADARTLYPILGVTGSAHLGAALTPAQGNAIAAAAISSGSTSWVLFLNKDGTLQEEELPGSTTTLASKVALDSTVVLSPEGAAAALLSPSTRMVVVVTGLPTKPQVTALQLPSAYAAAGVAVSDAGTVVAGMNMGNSGGVQVGLISPTTSYSAVASIGGWGGGAFVPAAGTGSATEAAVVADSSSAQLTYLANLGGTSPSVAAISSSGLIQKAAGVGVSPDGKWALVADSGKPQIVRVSLVQGGPTPSVVACACSPQQVSPLTADGIYSIGSNVSGQPAWILDARTSTPRTFFVPALPSSTANQTASASAAQSDGKSR